MKKIDDVLISRIRLVSHRLSMSDLHTPHDVISRMGMLQAQDYSMAKWAIGIRIPGYKDKTVEDSFNRGEILRTHVMRPTWHFVSPENIRWMLKLSASRIKNSVKSRDLHLGITEDLYTQTNDIIQKLLEGNKHQTRDEIATVFERSGIHADSSRMVHFMMRAEIEGLVCSGAMKGKKHTYALLEERVPETRQLTKDESLAKLARIYFEGHNPATIQDFVWWSGLSLSEARHAIEMIKGELFSESMDSQVYWFTDVPWDKTGEKDLVCLLPAFDEYLVGYRDRKAVLSSENQSRAISSNGIFRPVIVKNGKIIGIWKKSTVKNKWIQSDFFDQPDVFTQELVEKASVDYGTFYQ